MNTFLQKGNFMARPKKEPEITYTHHINLRLTDVQYEIISENARRAELSLSEYTPPVNERESHCKI